MLWDSTLLYRSDPRVPRGDETNEHHISVRFQRHLVSKDASSPVYFDAKPDWYSATVPQCAIPGDLTGKHIFRVQSSQRIFPSTPKPASSFPEWIQQLPASAERRLVSSPSFEECGAEMELLQYLQIPCTLRVGTAGGNRYESGSFSWIICSPNRERLALNMGPAVGGRAQMSEPASKRDYRDRIPPSLR